MDPNANPFVPANSQGDFGPIGSRRPSQQTISRAMKITNPAEDTPHRISSPSEVCIRLGRTNSSGTANQSSGPAPRTMPAKSPVVVGAPPSGPRGFAPGPRGSHVVPLASGSASASGSGSAPNKPSSTALAMVPATATGTGTDKPSVKHLTCFYWHTFGRCRFSDHDCLYSHHNTGQLAEAPQKVEAGGPSVAGRNLTALTIHKSTSEQQGINLPPGWSSPSYQSRPLPFRSPRSPFISPTVQHANMTYTPQNQSPGLPPKVELTIGQAHQLYATLHHVEQQAIKKIEICKHNFDNAKFLSELVMGTIDHAKVSSDMLKIMQRDMEGLSAALEDIQRKMEHCKEVLKPRAN